MFEVLADQKKNRLYFALKGEMSATQVNEAVKCTIKEAGYLRDSFDVINDLTEFRPKSPHAVLAMMRALHYIKGRNARSVIRVINNESESRDRVRQTSVDMGFTIDEMGSVLEAEKELDRQSQIAI